jgi:endonuclease/exonuclease/phosphatase (EEP) superfamily protein YafD
MRFHKVCFLLFTSLLFVGCSGPKSKTIKVMTWNIWHGGLHGTEADGFKKDSVNTINVYKVIHQEAPDVLLMQETYCCGMEIAEQAGYPHSVRASSNLSIHSKYPIMDTLKIFNPFNAHAVVIDVEGQELLFVNTWLHYLPDSFEGIKTMSPDSLIANEGPTRLKEITAIISALDRLKTSLKIPVIIGGDFNSPSHLDWVESTKEFHYGKVVAWPVSTLMQERDYIDSFREAHPDPTQTLEGTWGYLSPREIISDRIDFVYYKGQNLKTISSKIVMEDPEGGFFNSDHRAILTQFELKN